MIIDCHGHYTTEPKDLHRFRKEQTAAANAKDKTAMPSRAALKMSDDEIRESIEQNQLKLQRERGTDVTIFSPRASGMGHHIGDESVSLEWSQICNDLIARVVSLYPKNFIGVCQLPQSPGVPPEHSAAELERCVKMGFVGCNLNPDPSGGYFNSPPMTDKSWFPLYEKMIELDVPCMIHVSGCCNPAMHTTGSYYLNADTMVFMQVLLSDLFKTFPKLKFIIPHGGGAVPFHWGRFRGIALNNGKPELAEIMGENIFLRHLRLSSAGHRPAHQSGADRQHPFCIGNGRRGERQRSENRLRLRRHQTLCRQGAAQRRRQEKNLRGQCAQGLSAHQDPPGGKGVGLKPASYRSSKTRMPARNASIVRWAGELGLKRW
jgi:4-oxalmesaconate hydratase